MIPVDRTRAQRDHASMRPGQISPGNLRLGVLAGVRVARFNEARADQPGKLAYSAALPNLDCLLQ